ncbi:DUF481 domain-containing protein [Algibacillus agarilyticus]|uniref:DUF481 domain-containing protein n=1 Tax=Algibacillus agarilyticus TaxID=2234133 RepID=UPI001E347B69|nr:DUF481 domain-containing protein [Algibacillus agarilyticus]
MKLTTFKISALAATLLAANVCAETEAEQSPWEASAELGAIFTSGNTETTSVKGKLDVKHELESWSNQYILDALFKEDKVDQDGEKVTQKTAERYFASAQGNYKLNEQGSSLFIYGSHTDDKFAGVSKYTTLSAGYGQRLYKDETSLLKGDIGPGYVWSQQQDTVDDQGNVISAPTDTAGIIRASVDYKWKINKFSTFTQAVSVEAPFDSDKNRRTKSETGFSAKISNDLSMKLGLTITNNSKVSLGTEKTDTETSVTVVYVF